MIRSLKSTFGSWTILVALSIGHAAIASKNDQHVSPSRVLKEVDATLSNQNVRFPRGPRDRLEMGEDQTLSPYFYVAGGDPNTERLPLKEISADVQIAGVIAKVKIRQVFENSGSKPIEAVYVFPASTRAAVHGMRMKIGQRTIEAKIEKKAVAREEYEQAKQQGKRASLLEQERPNVFTMSVANIMPKDKIHVELDYSELLVPEDATYEFVYPTVVGPRYGGGVDPQKDKWIENPYLPEGKKEPYKFGIQVHLEAGIPIKKIVSPSHKIKVEYLSKTSANIQLNQKGGGNKDYVLQYRLAGNQIETGLLLWQGKQESFFLLMVEPPRRPQQEQIPSREYIFLLDVSGSMRGFPLDTTKVLMQNLFSQLRPSDYFNIVMFSGGSFVLNPEGSLPATPANIKLAADTVNRQRGGGGTELMGGFKTAYGIPKKHSQISRSVIVTTDGYVGVEAQAFKFVREHLNEANLFAFGIGSSVNRALIEAMARAGVGEPFVVLGPNTAKQQTDKLRETIQYPVLANASVTFSGFDAKEVAPQKIPDLMALRPLVVFGKFVGKPKGTIKVKGVSGKGDWKKTIKIQPNLLKEENAPIQFLWARKWVAMLDDELALAPGNVSIEKTITDLGLSYNLLTAFTSFVAVDSEVANNTQELTSVKQPLPLPEGVSNYAIGSKGMVLQSRVKSRRSTMAPRAPSGIPTEAAIAPGRLETRSGVPRALAEEKETTQDTVAWNIMITDVDAKGLTDTAPILKAVEERLHKAQKQCHLSKQIIKLELVIDSKGNMIRVAILEAQNKNEASCVVESLKKLTSKTKAKGSEGVLKITFRVR